MTSPIRKDVITVSSLERSKSTYESYDAEMLSSWQLKYCMWHYHPVRVCVCVFVCMCEETVYECIYLSIYLHVTNTWRKAPTTDNSSSASEEIPCTSSDQKTHNRVHKKPRKVPTQSQMNPVHYRSPYFLYIRFSNILPSTHTAPQFRFWHQTPKQNSLPIVGHEVTPLSSSLCYIVTCLLLFLLSLLRISSSAPSSPTSSAYVITLMWETRLHIHTKQQTRVLQWYNTCQVS
jgi:hypothetical protein